MSLPSGYKRLEYIQSTGTQYVDTGFKPTGSTKVVCDFQMINQGSTQQGVFGSRPGTSGRFTVFTGYSNSDLQVDYDTAQTLASVSQTINGLNVNSRTTIEVSNSLIINGNTVKTVPVVSFTSTYNLFLFANNNVGTAQLPCSMKLYSCQIYDNGNLIRDFVPCIDPTGNAGLYDLVDGKFYGNAGTSVFLAGTPKDTLPEGYTQLEYIQSSGAQYVDTEFRPKNTTKVMMDFQVTAQPKSHQIIFGERTSYSGADQFVLGYTGHKSPAVWRSDFGNSQVSFPSTVLWSTRMTVVRNGPDCTLNGTAVKNSSAVFSSTHNLFLLANNDNETAAGHISAKLYLCQISDGEKIARFFIPCKNAGGAVGLYDLIGQKFYGNAGTGTFTAGPVIAIAIDESEITELEYIQGSGTQYINTGIMPNQDTRLDLQASFAQTGSHTVVGADLGWTANGFSIGVGFAHYGTETSNINGMNDGLMHLISMDKNTLSVDGVSVHAFSAQTFFVGYPLVLFANNRSGSIEEITTMTLCSSQIYDNGTIVRNYIPCQTTSGEIGLWDALNKMFYRNAGTGTFTAGPVKVSPLNLPVNIGGTWKNANEVFVNIGGTWKTVESAFVNIDGTWKELG
jgi:hypothetical protein